jgi:hypothetical protein
MACMRESLLNITGCAATAATQVHWSIALLVSGMLQCALAVRVYRVIDANVLKQHV